LKRDWDGREQGRCEIVVESVEKKQTIPLGRSEILGKGTCAKKEKRTGAMQVWPTNRRNDRTNGEKRGQGEGRRARRRDTFTGGKKKEGGTEKGTSE